MGKDDNKIKPKPKPKPKVYGIENFGKRTQIPGGNALSALLPTSNDSGDTYKRTQYNDEEAAAQGSFWPSASRGAAQLGNFGIDAQRNTTNFVDTLLRGISGRGQAPQGGGLGDSMFGSRDFRQSNKPVAPGALPPDREGSRYGMQRGGGAGEEQAPAAMGLAEYLRMAQDIMGGGGGVNYDPQRQLARSQAGEADARLEAMYRQLRGSVDADAAVLGSAYQEAQDSTAQNTVAAQEQTQGAADSANARNSEVLANLGIQQAQGNIIQEGRDLNTQAAAQVGDLAARGQSAGNRLVTNKASALQHNTNVGNAAGLEGNLQRASNQAKLQALLGEIDMQEQQENSAAQQNFLSQSLGLAQNMQGRDDDLQRSALGMANDRYAAELEAQSQASQMPDLQSMLTELQRLGIKLEDLDPRDQVRLITSKPQFAY
tara:strand:+ start:25352 stop:26641 length:1290 start_codon:yes stop_codon:yes gene_type:complete